METDLYQRSLEQFIEILANKLGIADLEIVVLPPVKVYLGGKPTQK